MKTTLLLKKESNFPISIRRASGALHLAYCDTAGNVKVLKVDSSTKAESDEQQIGTTASKSPGLVIKDDLRYVAYRENAGSGGDDSPIYFAVETKPATGATSTWAANAIKQTDRQNPATDNHVSLSVFKELIYALYKRNSTPAHLLGIAWYDPSKSTWAWNKNGNIEFQKGNTTKKDDFVTEGGIENKSNVKYGGIDRGSKIIVTNTAPALATIGSGDSEKLCIAFLENGPSNEISFGTSNTPEKTDGWTFETIKGVRTKGELSLTRHGSDKLVLAYANLKEGNKIYLRAYTTTDGWGKAVEFKNDKNNTVEMEQHHYIQVGSDGSNLYLSYNGNETVVVGKGSDKKEEKKKFAYVYKIDNPGL